jgi:hypothetical protein
MSAPFVPVTFVRNIFCCDKFIANYIEMLAETCLSFMRSAIHCFAENCNVAVDFIGRSQHRISTFWDRRTDDDQ